MAIKVLIIDDSSVMRKIIERSLVQAGFELRGTMQAANGSEALALVWASQDVDLILCDYHMREMDGLAFVREVRKIPKLAAVPVIIVSTEAALQNMDEAKGAGISAFLAKPFTPDKLKEVISRVLKT